MADVFISYRNTPERRAYVRRLATILRVYGIEVWWDYGLEAGDSYRDQILAKLAAARVVAPLWCDLSIHSQWVAMEAEFGKDKLVPARLQKVVPPSAFEAIQVADLIGWDGAVGSPRMLTFVRKICERLGRPGLAPADMLEDLADLKPLPPLPEVMVPLPPPIVRVGLSPDHAFYERQWNEHRTGENLTVLQTIADDAPRIFAEQAKARIAEIVDRQREAAERAAQHASYEDPKTGLIRTLTGHMERVWSVALSPDGRLALSGGGEIADGADFALRLWDLATGRVLRTFTGHTDKVISVAFAPDGRTALSGSDDTTLKLWDVATGRALRTFTGHMNSGAKVAFASDGRTALSDGDGKTLKLWDVATGRALRTFIGHTKYVDAVVFAPDGRTALSGSRDETLKLWDLATGRELRTFIGHTKGVTSVAVMLDGRTALSGSDDDTLRL